MIGNVSQNPFSSRHYIPPTVYVSIAGLTNKSRGCDGLNPIPSSRRTPSSPIRPCRGLPGRSWGSGTRHTMDAMVRKPFRVETLPNIYHILDPLVIISFVNPTIHIHGSYHIIGYIYIDANIHVADTFVTTIHFWGFMAPSPYIITLLCTRTHRLTSLITCCFSSSSLNVK